MIQRILPAGLATAGCLVALVGLLVSCDALVLHHVGAFAQLVALGTGAVVGARAWIGLRRVVELLRSVRRASAAVLAALEPGLVGTVAGAAPRVFTLGLLRPRVVMTLGVVATLEPAAVQALLAHESVHARQRDTLRRILADGLRAAAGVSPATALRDHYDLLLELRADRAALRGGRAEGLAIAMETLDATGTPVHPARVDHLIDGAPALPSLRRVVSLLAAGILAGLGLIAFLVANTHCTDIFYLQENDASAHRWSALLVLALAAAAIARRRPAPTDRPGTGGQFPAALSA